MTGSPSRRFVGIVCGLVVFFLLNAVGVWWLGATVFASDAFYDGSAAILTLALPAFVGGLIIGLIARGQGLRVALVSFVLLGAFSLAHLLWRVPLVSPHSAHSGAMHYMLRSPLVALAFGALGAWLAEQFTQGRFRLADPAPVLPPDRGDD